MADWTEKYRPTTLSEVRGNNKARDAFAEWAETWDEHREAVVLHGSPGVGKTSAAHALATDMGWETMELNASDQRTSDVVERFAGRAARNATLGGSAGREGQQHAGEDGVGRQLVILDEADNLHGNYDRGGSRAITDLVKTASQPIVLLANEYYDMSRGLRGATQEIEFRDVSARSIVPVLRDICRRESLEFEKDTLQRIAERNRGDLRGAVNDLQAIGKGRSEIRLEDVVTGDRDQTVGIFPFLDDILQEEESAQEALYTAYDVEETPDDITSWVEENLLRVYDSDEAALAYDYLANADVWLGRVYATQNYSYWRYTSDNAAAGVAAARSDEKSGWTRWSRPQFYPSSDATGDDVVRRIAQSGGTSMATARREVLPYLSAVTHHCKPREATVQMAATYDFDTEHVAYVTGSGESTNKVASVVDDAQDLREARVQDHAEGAFESVRQERETEDQSENGGDASADKTELEADTAGSDPSAETVSGGSGEPQPGEDEISPEDRAGDAEDDDGQAGLGDFV